MKNLLSLIVLPALLLAPWANAYDKVIVSRKVQDFYEVEGGRLFIKTRFCYEYVLSDKALLEVYSPSGYSAGMLVFSSGRKCDVERLIHV